MTVSPGGVRSLKPVLVGICYSSRRKLMHADETCPEGLLFGEHRRDGRMRIGRN